MAEALRRTLWMIPLLVVGAVVVFLALSSLSTTKPQPGRSIFYNSAPESAQTAAAKALLGVREGTPGAALRLSELGGAALPTVLRRFPAMKIAEQRRVALALRPLAKRISLDHTQVGSALRSSSEKEEEPIQVLADRELLFWERYRDEHGLDLHPLATSRLVRRLKARESQGRNADLRAVDTYALPALISSLGRVKSDQDIARARRLVDAISQVSGNSWRVRDDSGIEETRILVTKIRVYWDREGAKWSQLDRFSLLVAHFSQSEFGRWTFRTARQISGIDHSEVARKLLDHGRVSLPLFFSSLIGLLIIGPILAASIKMVELRKSRWTLQTWGMRAGLTLALLSVTPLLVASQSSKPLVLGLVALLMGSIYSTYILHREINDRLDWRTHHVLRIRHRFSRALAIGQWIAPTIPTLTPIVVAESAVWITCLEVSSQLPGLGRQSLFAIQQGDTDFLMSICLGFGLLTGATQVLADLLVGTAQWRQGDT